MYQRAIPIFTEKMMNKPLRILILLLLLTVIGVAVTVPLSARDLNNNTIVK